MNHQEFSIQMDRLKDVYTDRPYSNERVKLIWREVSRLSGEAFSRIVDNLISSQRQPPMLTEIRDQIALERERTSSEPKAVAMNWEASYNCDFCRDLGIFVCTQGESLNFYAFRCHCEKGSQHQGKHIPHYKSGHREQGYQWFDVRKLAEIRLSRIPELEQ